MAEVFGFDCYSPREIAEKVENIGVVKANLPLLPMAALGFLAGAFIGFGALFSTIVLSDNTLGFGVARVFAGFAFSLGLILVVVAGAELFTGNNLLVMACVARRITVGKMLRNCAVAYVTNFLGATSLAAVVAWSGHAQLGEGAVGRTAVAIATTKVMLPFWEAFLRGILCNVLVCLAVWLTMAGRSVTDKILGIVFPITTFVAAGFEHSVANMYLLPLGIFLGADIGFADIWHNLIPVTLGNVVGGAGMVGLVYHIIYRRAASPHSQGSG